MCDAAFILHIIIIPPASHDHIFGAVILTMTIFVFGLIRRHGYFLLYFPLFFYFFYTTALRGSGLRLLQNLGSRRYRQAHGNWAETHHMEGRLPGFILSL